MEYKLDYDVRTYLFELNESKNVFLNLLGALRRHSTVDPVCNEPKINKYLLQSRVLSLSLSIHDEWTALVANEHEQQYYCIALGF